MTSEVTRAAEILLERREARHSFKSWAKACGFVPAKHHELIIDKLEQAANGTIKRLAIFLPPGAAKSTYSSILYPPWFLAQRPNSAILTCSHSTDLAESFGRRSRNLILDHGKMLGFELAQDSQAAGKWSTTNGSEFFCAGVGSHIAGRRADLGLIDDPIGSREDAYSKLLRDKVWAWWLTDFCTRLKPDASVILIQTRYHEDDLAGRILASEGSEWTIINLPLIAGENDPLGRKPGETLWPEWFNEKLVLDAQKDPTTFNSLYQQNPIPESGDFFKRSWIEPYVYQPNDLPKNLRIYVASDHAVSTKQTADLTCLLPGGVDESGVLWILPDLFWKRCDSEEAVSAMVEMMRRRRPFEWFAESGHISKSIGPFLYKRMREKGCYTCITEVHPAKDKATRAQSIRGRMSMGMVRWPAYTSWYPDALHQMLSFPVGKNDDLVDTLAHLGAGLDKMLDAEGVRVEATPQMPVFESVTYGWIKGSTKKRELAEVVRKLDY